MERQTKQQDGKAHNRPLIFREKTLVVALLLFIVIVGALVAAYIGCDQIARERGMDQLKDASNTVIDQISAKLDRDRDVLRAAAEIITSYNVLKTADSPDKETVDALKVKFREINPLRQSMQLRILLSDDRVLLPTECIIHPDGSFEEANGNILEASGALANGSEFRFAQEKEHKEHVSHRFEAMIQTEDGERVTQTAIAEFVPIYSKPGQQGEIVAMLYGLTILSDLPNELRFNNIYNDSAKVMIFDVKNEIEADGERKHAVVMNTWHGEPLGYLENFDMRKSRGKSAEEIKEEILSISDLTVGDTSASVSGYTQFRSASTGQWVFFYYASARNIVRNQWCIGIVVSSSAVFGNAAQIRTVFLIAGGVVGVAIVAYFFWIRRGAKRTIEKTVERAVLEERLHKAEAAERAKTTFLSNMSHDIRTPMNAILGFTALAETNIDNRERVQDYLKKIMSSGNHLLSLINDILDMSRIESGKLNIEEKPCSISDIFHDMRNIIQTQMKNKQLNFFMDTLDIVDEEIYCDKLHVNQVLLNLLSNAIKFTPAGGSVSLMISQKPGAPKGYGAYQIRVKDTGIGMSEEFATHVFEPFERERNSTVSGIQGTGLGMAITKNIVDTMGGTIRVETAPGKGTEFIIDLTFRLQSERKRVEVIRELAGLRALVVDDSFSTCDSVSKMLMQIGMRAEWTMHGKEAVLRAQQAVDIGDTFSAYIIDWVMPDLSGFEIVRQIRKIVGEETPIIVITAYDITAIMDEAQDIGITAFCNKPIFLSELRDTLVSALEQISPAKDEETQEAQKAQEAPQESAPMNGKRLLLVEDNELNREIAEELLLEHGFEVDTAEDGTVAVEKVAAAEPGYYDLILMDVQMPVMNGYEATRRIRAMEDGRRASVPIIAMTANAFDEDRKKAAECGMNAHVAKPIDIDRLMSAIHSFLKET